MKAETTRRPLFRAWASTFLMKWTRAALPIRAQHLGDDCLDALVRVGDDELDASEATSGELAQELGPDRLGLGGADLHAQHLAPAVSVDPDGNDDADRDDAPLLLFSRLRFNSRNPSKQKRHLQTDPPNAAFAAWFNP